MPYFVTDQHPDCPAWATVKEGGELVACHGSEQDAIDQMVAISVAEDIEPGGTYEGEFRETRDVDLTPPEYMRDAASQGLEYYSEGLAGEASNDEIIEPKFNPTPAFVLISESP
jgi:hypothetical protein